MTNTEAPTATLLLDAGRPVRAFADITAMRRWMTARGGSALLGYTRTEIPLHGAPGGATVQVLIGSRPIAAFANLDALRRHTAAQGGAWGRTRTEIPFHAA
jgi:hypothetical protein